jgi:hypothetical protein
MKKIPDKNYKQITTDVKGAAIHSFELTFNTS